MLVGYARISTDGQTLDPQLDALRQAGCEKVFSDTASGGGMSRPGLDQALEFCRAGDVLVVVKLDRLGRTTKGLIELADVLQARQVGLKSLSDPIDTTTPAGRLFFVMLAAFAELERSLIIERTHAGLAAARSRGRKGGRRPAMTDKQVEAARLMLAAPDSSVAEVAKAFGIGRSTLHRYVGAAANCIIAELPPTDEQIAEINARNAPNDADPVIKRSSLADLFDGEPPAAHATGDPGI